MRYFCWWIAIPLDLRLLVPRYKRLGSRNIVRRDLPEDFRLGNLSKLHPPLPLQAIALQHPNNSNLDQSLNLSLLSQQKNSQSSRPKCDKACNDLLASEIAHHRLVLVSSNEKSQAKSLLLGLHNLVHALDRNEPLLLLVDKGCKYQQSQLPMTLQREKKYLREWGEMIPLH